MDANEGHGNLERKEGGELHVGKGKKGVKASSKEVVISRYGTKI